MTQNKTIRQCLWLIAAIRQQERITLRELQKKWTANYLRTLPLHHSQQEIATTEEYADFSFDIRPTPDFIGELLKYDQGVEVLNPPGLRLKICKIYKEILNRY